MSLHVRDLYAFRGSSRNRFFEEPVPGSVCRRAGWPKERYRQFESVGFLFVGGWMFRISR